MKLQVNLPGSNLTLLRKKVTDLRMTLETMVNPRHLRRFHAQGARSLDSSIGNPIPRPHADLSRKVHKYRDRPHKSSSEADAEQTAAQE